MFLEDYLPVSKADLDPLKIKEKKMNSSTKHDVQVLAQQIENLARALQAQVTAGTDYLHTANELARNNLTLVFTIGEVYGTESAAKKTVQGQVVSKTTRAPQQNYHNLRDDRGRFARKV